MDESGFGGVDPNQLAGGIGGFLSGLFDNSGSPYKSASKIYDQYRSMNQGLLNPFYQNGINAIPQYQQWLQSQQDPSHFINNLMNQYQESPWAHYLQQQTLRSGLNAASAGGGGEGNPGGAGLGSTPFLQQAQQNAANISSGDIQNWLGRVLGINSQYGQGVGNMVTSGQNAGNSLVNMNTEFARALAEAKYGQKAGENQDRSNMWGGLINTGLALLPAVL